MLNEIDPVLRWCERLLGAADVIADHTREHFGLRAACVACARQLGEALG